MRFIRLILALALAAPLTVGAQEKETVDPKAAQQRVEEAQRQLRAALEELGRNRAESMDVANAALRKAIEELRAAQRDLRADEYADLAYRLRLAEPANVSLFLSEGRPRMGVLLAETTQREAWDSLGVKLSAVTPGGPAEEAGLKAGDLIVTANGKALGRKDRRDESPNQKLVATINELKEGDALQVDYLRDGKRASATVKVRNLEPASYAFSMLTADSNRMRFDVTRPELAFTWEGPQEGRIARVAPNLISTFMPFQWFNMELVELNAELGSYFGTTEGLLVVRAPDDESFALKSGDVILSIDGRPPTSPAHALRIMRSYEPGESMKIDVMREKKRQTVTVTIPERDRGFFWQPDGK
jgi:C-terminal processing protease CtpA/Prc